MSHDRRANDFKDQRSGPGGQDGRRTEQDSEAAGTAVFVTTAQIGLGNFRRLARNVEELSRQLELPVGLRWAGRKKLPSVAGEESPRRGGARCALRL